MFGAPVDDSTGIPKRGPIGRQTMSKVTLDNSLKAKLNGLNEQLEFCDETGNSLGHFLPTDVYKELLLAWADAQISPEELDRRRREPRGRTLEDICKSLGRS
jgi:hypothetical protein